MSELKIYTTISGSCGVELSFDRDRSEITTTGWYDDCMDLGTDVMKLSMMFSELGITLEDCKKALEAPNELR